MSGVAELDGRNLHQLDSQKRRRLDHRIVNIDLDGEAFELRTGDGEQQQFLLLGLKRLRVLGLTIDAAS